MAFAFDAIFYQFRDPNGKREWYEFWKLTKPDNNLSVERIMGVMLFGAVITFLIALYVEKILPGEYDIPEKWNFPFKKEFWFPSSPVIVDNETNDSETVNDFLETVNDYIEIPRNLHASVSVKRLCKTFANTKKSVVKDLTFKMYDDEILGKIFRM